MVVMLMTLFIITQYAGKPKLVPVLRGVSAAEQTAAAQALDTLGVEYKLVNGVPSVPPDRRPAIYAQLGQAGALPRDSSASFDDLVAKLSPWNTKSQNDAILIGYRQRVLEHTIRLMSGVHEAKVLIDNPRTVAFGARNIKPTASVTLFMEGGAAVTQKFANAVASTVAGSIAGLEVDNVRVIDGLTSKWFVIREDDVASGSDYLEQKLKYERSMHEKLMQFLSYIPDVRISVTAVVDASPTRLEKVEYLNQGKGSVGMVKEEEKTLTSTSGPSAGGEPAINPNTSLNIAGSSGSSGETSSSETKSTRFDNQIGKQVTSTYKPGGKATLMNIAIGIPREYVVQVWKQENPDSADTEPTNSDIDQTRQQELDKVKQLVENQLIVSAEAGAPKGEVYVSMIPVSLDLTHSSDRELGGSGGGTMGTILASGTVKNVALGSLAVIALAMMFLMVRKASKPGELPTAEDLLGIPPTLLAEDSDTVGEADDASPTLTGVELDDDDVRDHRLLEQINDLTRDDPESVAKLVNRWVKREE